MKTIARLSCLGALCVTVLLLIGASDVAHAQTASEASAPKSSTPEELSQAELLKSYLQMREQLQATQLAIVNNRVAGVTEKLDAIKSAMDAERDRQQAEMQRLTAERERLQAETQRSNRTVLWIAAGFGGIGLIAILLMPLLQWRAMSRMAEVSALRPTLAPPPAGPALLPADPGASDQTVTLSNQRLMSVIDRIERRILELEHSTVHPLPAVAVTPANGTDFVRRAPATGDQAAWIAVLLGKGRSLLSANKAIEAVTCYDEILKLDAIHTEALVRKGTALERLSRFEEALQCYDRAIAIDGKMTLAYLSKGGVCNRLGRYDEALECYEQALQAAEKAK